MSNFFVSIEGVKADGAGTAGGSHWVDARDIGEAILLGLTSFKRMWEAQGHRAPVTYRIVVAPPMSPRRTAISNLPLPVEDEPKVQVEVEEPLPPHLQQAQKDVQGRGYCGVVFNAAGEEWMCLRPPHGRLAAAQ
jgi:hypothetical protein